MYEIIGRRGFLKTAAMSITASSLTSCATKPDINESILSPDRKLTGRDNISNTAIFDDEAYSFQLLRALGHTYSGGTDINECLETAHRINEGDEESWYDEWLKTAMRILAIAEKSEAGGHLVSAREAYLRASNYFRSAEFFLHADISDTRAYEAWKMSRDCFLKAIPYLSNTIEKVEIPFEGTSLPGYFITAEGVKKKAPLLIIFSGFDGIAEEECLTRGIPAAIRGYHCLVFEGPGQGKVIRDQKIPFRHNWETVVTPVIDYAQTLPGVDTSRIVLYGVSFGGWLAPRASAFEDRIHTCIANGGVFSFYDSMTAEVPASVMSLKNSNPKAFESAIREMMSVNLKARWFVNDSLWKFGADSPTDLFIKLESYTLEGVLEKIKCNMLVVDGEEEHFFAGQAKKLYDLLNCPKEYMLFTRAEVAASHCQFGAEAIAAQRIYDWLDDTVKKT